MSDVLIKPEKGKRKVRIDSDRLDNNGKAYLHTMRNGFQWCGQPIDLELAEMMQEALTHYIENEKELLKHD